MPLQVIFDLPFSVIFNYTSLPLQRCHCILNLSILSPISSWIYLFLNFRRYCSRKIYFNCFCNFYFFQLLIEIRCLAQIFICWPCFHWFYNRKFYFCYSEIFFSNLCAHSYKRSTVCFEIMNIWLAWLQWKLMVWRFIKINRISNKIKKSNELQMLREVFRLDLCYESANTKFKVSEWI